MTSQVGEHGPEIEAKREAWRTKPLLRRIYARFYDSIGAQLGDGLTLELGSGLGQIREFLPDCVTSDLLPGPGVDRVESAYSVGLPDSSVSNLVLLDVWHHLQFPGAALREFGRVLSPGGRVILLEPAMGLLPRIIYGFFHHEALGLTQEMEWEPTHAEELRAPPYFAAQSQAWRMFRRGEVAEELHDWRVAECCVWSDFAYLASGGFSRRALYPASLLTFIEALDRLLTRASPRLFAARMMVVLEKR